VFPAVLNELKQFVTVQLYIDFIDDKGAKPYNELLKNKYEIVGAIPIYAIELSGEPVGQTGGSQSIESFREFLTTNLDIIRKK